jgi:hypothetical protein
VASRPGTTPRSIAAPVSAATCLRHRLDVDGAVERRAAERLGEHRGAVLGDDDRVQLVEAAGAVGGAGEAGGLGAGATRQR